MPTPPGPHGLQDRPTLLVENEGLTLLLAALAAVVVFHGGLLPFTHGNTYDAFIHMFMGDHYSRSWFDPWEPRWYTGFATTSYPPGTHMAIAALMQVMPLRAAFVVVQLIGLLVLTVGTYRFALLWVKPRAAGYAALALVLASSISETIHLFGQLPTICSLGIFLNGLPHVYRWIVVGRWSDLAAAVIFSAATTACHHVTTIFGGVLFVVPLALQALRAVAEIRPGEGQSLLWRLRRFVLPFARGILLAVLMLGTIVLTVFAYWHWSITDPITQVPIPHGSRESFLDRLDLGFVFFLLPWGMSLLVLPYALRLTLTTRLWPLGGSLFLCLLLGTGGTTPLPRAILGGAFDILTLDRFSFWGSILVLPFTGHLVAGLLHGRAREALRGALGAGLHRALLSLLFAGYAVMAVLPAVLPSVQPTQPDFIEPAPIVKFLEQDEHDRWRYLTLGFGDQFAYVSALTTAQSVDGNYHSARRLPDMTRFSVERLENAKYLGVPGLGSLQQFLVNAERYHLKYVFSNDAFYDPILHFTGWNRLNRLENGITVWEKPDIPAMPLVQPRRDIPPLQVLMWGVLPPLAISLAFIVLAVTALRRNFGIEPGELRPVAEARYSFARPRLVRAAVVGLAALATAGILAGVAWSWQAARHPLPPQAVVEAYFEHLDFRRHAQAYELLDPETRPPYDAVLFNWRWTGGLAASYGKLENVTIIERGRRSNLYDWEIRLHWLTSLERREQVVRLRTVRRDGRWFVVPSGLRPVQTPALLQRDGTVDWNVVGRRQPRPETDLHRDRNDRPEIRIDHARLVRKDDRYALVGQATNTDADPAGLSLFGTLMSGETPLARQASGIIAPQRLLPAETGGFRIDFEGVLSLEEVIEAGEYDPTLFIPPELGAEPDRARLEARAVVSSAGLYPDIALNAVRTYATPQGLRVEGLAVNTGTKVASIVRVDALCFGPDGRPLWAEAGFVNVSIAPGQSAAFALTLPRASEVEVLSELGPDGITVNGSGQMGEWPSPGADDGTIPLDGAGGYASLRLSTSAMTHDPLF